MGDIGKRVRVIEVPEVVPMEPIVVPKVEPQAVPIMPERVPVPVRREE